MKRLSKLESDHGFVCLSSFDRLAKLGSDPGFGSGFVVWRSSDRWFSRLRRALLSSCFAKKKATLVDAGRCPVPCATQFGRGHPGSTSSRCCASLRALRNSPLRGSNSPRPLSAPTCVAQRLTRGPKGVAERAATRSFKRCAGSAAWACGGFPRPVDSAEQRRASRKEREDCLRGVAPSSTAPANDV